MPTQQKLDFRKTDRPYYTASPEPVLLDLAPCTYLVRDGRGDPAGPEFEAAFGALYPMAYGVKFACKAAGADFVVPPSEALWWVEGHGPAGDTPRRDWYWKLMLRVPDFVTPAMVEEVREVTAKKKGEAAVAGVVLETLDEGRCAQILHRGPYADEMPTVERLHAFVAEQGLELRGDHHEIYLSDPKRTAPERMRTLLRHPVCEGMSGSD